MRALDSIGVVNSPRGPRASFSLDVRYVPCENARPRVVAHGPWCHEAGVARPPQREWWDRGMSGMAAPRTEISSHRLDVPAFAERILRRQRRRFAWLLALQIALCVGVLGVLMGLGLVPAENLTLTIPVLLVALGIGVLVALRKQRGQLPIWESYQLALGEHVMRRSLDTLPAMEILRTEVARIFDAPSEGLTVTTADARRFIFIPRELVGIDSVRERLSAWAAFEAPTAPAWLRARRFGGALVLPGLWLASGFIADIHLALAAGVALIALGAVRILHTARSAVMDGGTQARIIGLHLFMMLSPIARAVLHFGFHMEVKWPT